MKIWKTIEKHNMVFWLGCLVGSLVFVLIYGWDVVTVTNVDWLLDSSKREGLWDLTQHYLGWEFYRKSPWQFPLGLVEGLYSEAVSVVYTDSIPLFALLFKLFSPVLPEHFQYFGIFQLMCYGLMGGFSGLLARKWTRNPLLCQMTAFLFALSPAMMKRAFYHTALSAHFLVVAAICLWVYQEEIDQKGKRRSGIWWILLILLSAGINAYFTPMVLGIMLCAKLQELLKANDKKRILVHIITETGGAIISLAVMCYVLGYFYGDVSASTTGLTDLSFNLLQFINPGNDLCYIDHRDYLFTTQNYSGILPTLPTVSGWQEEGFSYLGVGVLLLLICNVVAGVVMRCRRETMRMERSWIISIAFGMVIFTFLALSPKGTIGTRVLYDIAYPELIYKALSVFRSTGRLIWPVYYGLMALVLWGGIRLWEENKGRILWKKAGVIFLGIICVIQLLDLMPGIRYKHDAYACGTEVIQQETTGEAKGYRTYLTDERWQQWGEQMDQIMFYTPSMYGVECDPMTSCIFEELALEYDLSLNVTYMSRDLSIPADERTMAHFEERKSGASYPTTLYIFFDISDIPPAEEVNLSYYHVDGYTVGVEN